MEDKHGANTSTVSKWVQLKDGIPTEEIGVPAVASSDPTMDTNDVDSGPPDFTLRPQYKNPPRPGNLQDLPIGLDPGGVGNATPPPPSGGQQQGATPSDLAPA